jgi:hypothetical protein
MPSSRSARAVKDYYDKKRAEDVKTQRHRKSAR